MTEHKPAGAEAIVSHRMIDPPRLDATVRVDVERGIMWVLGDPLHLGRTDDDEGAHSCDEWGCSSFGAHVLAAVRYRADRPSDSGDGSPTAETRALIRLAATLTRERDEARRAWCSSMIGDPGYGIPATAAEVACHMGWSYLYPEGAVE